MGRGSPNKWGEGPEINGVGPQISGVGVPKSMGRGAPTCGVGAVVGSEGEDLGGVRGASQEEPEGDHHAAMAGGKTEVWGGGGNDPQPQHEIQLGRPKARGWGDRK